jgi:hypothetical protein
MDEEQMKSEINELFGITEETTSDATDIADETSAETDADAKSEASTETTQQDSTSTESTESNPATESKTETASTQTPAEDTPLDPEEKFQSKRDSAFAQMRIQNKEMSDLIMNLAKATGQTPKNMAEAQAMLNEGLTKVVSKNRNIPEDVLREMEEDKKQLAELKQTQARQNALAGFQQVKDTFQLSRNDVNDFADKLIEKNINPYEQNVNLVEQYKLIYFEQLIAKAKEQGVQEERARSLKAQQNSTTPTNQNGLSETTGNQGKPIKTVNDLDALLSGLK